MRSTPDARRLSRSLSIRSSATKGGHGTPTGSFASRSCVTSRQAIRRYWTSDVDRESTRSSGLRSVEVFGFDISPNNIAVAKRLAEKYGFEERTHFTLGVAEECAYPSDSFDLVTGIDILHHVDIPRAVRECLRVLKRGGGAVFKGPNEGPRFDA